ncbi:adenylosuccinate synthase [Candidatus Aerophobetes bacterium]|uniref:Adenylosuccinate synthetase n=1 Tax=Aerophobetes bacterium TaxID=2030807 RepID=A0A2A4YGY7_UNCAE|nr:MAG: adenylosuccinate synthase [Candidatus Aerophobetes bacterium]
MASAIIGLQFGDEGKGKVIDLLSPDFTHIVRAQGGNNAGHSVIANGKEYHFHLIPSGVLYSHTKCYLGAGVVIDPEGLEKELLQLEKDRINIEGRLFISKYAHVVFPFHKILDKANELKKNSSIGTTGKGIGPCYTDRAARVGMRVADLLDEAVFEKMAKALLENKNKQLAMLGCDLLDAKAFYVTCEYYKKLLKPFACDIEQKIFYNIDPSKVLLEGAQGTFLDGLYGTYPFVTSSNTCMAGVCLGSGFPPRAIKEVIGVVKAYTTRVGNGFLVTEFEDVEKSILGDNSSAREKGTTTGRDRRMGWLDLVMLRYAIRLNGVTSLALTKLDILDHLEKIKICTSYEIGGVHSEIFPASTTELESSKPVYEILDGWMSSTKECKEQDDLPEKALNYLARIEEFCEVPIKIVSVGPEREKVIRSCDLTKRKISV